MINEEEIARLRSLWASIGTGTRPIDVANHVPALLDEVERLRVVDESRGYGTRVDCPSFVLTLAKLRDDATAERDDAWVRVHEQTERAEKAERERDALRARVADYESGCHHAWKALPTRYDVILDEHTGAGETRGDVNRRADWIETAIRDMGGDLERAEQDRDATRAANIESKRQRDCALVVLKQAEEALRVVHGHLGVGEHKPSDLYGWERAVVAALATLEGLRR